ncbi:hypothetical protein D9758_005469 [Tetrapyrgos nigripes]|uniref:Uncharacterized protein n=1 Tax=Tetrapyrgos nigripes TaxID=182062 RepID=A0A8H5GI22_9AGAR|nr:hypothetical protein D9758_005469 [Tetrapyrgos nigripes]
MNDTFFPQSLESFAALLICAEQSFWIMSQPGSLYFEAAFRDAWKMWKEDHAKAAHLHTALGRLSTRDEQSNAFALNEWKKELIKIILENRLTHANRQ